MPISFSHRGEWVGPGLISLARGDHPGPVIRDRLSQRDYRRRYTSDPVVSARRACL